MTGIGVKSLKKWVDDAQRAVPGSPPPCVDHTKEPHPYKSRYLETWKEKLAESVTMATSCCVNDLIDHIFLKLEEVFVSKLILRN